MNPIIEAHSQGTPVVTISKQLGIAESTVVNAVTKHNHEQQVINVLNIDMEHRHNEK